MTEIAQLFENALRHNRSTLLRQAAMRTVERMPGSTTLRELLETDAADAVRELTLEDLAESLRACRDGRDWNDEPGEPLDSSTVGRRPGGPRRLLVTAATPESQSSREERLYREILEALQAEPLTIGQLAKKLDLDTSELRGYLAWMKKMGKVESSGRARATRYQIVAQSA